ncbi:hypothetical protein RND71_039073 [Anisodus tanguticus]|uniref:Uncharacterized protein n=1 Tax=Anisodus tanguticus TaxID=243964 RepID=A0AAE1QYL3_9SOLA|nr:hypothetical protein RND71_039073 [Anisodus tanguticus]
MGCFCFLSSTQKTPPKPNTCNSHTKLQSHHRSPPLTLPFLEQEEEVKEILSETPIINDSPIIHTNENNNIPKNISPKEKQCHNIHDSVFKIAKIFNPKDELSHHEPSDIYRKFSRSIRVGSDTKATANELGKSIRVGSDPKEATRELSRHIRVGSDHKETNKEFSRSIRVGLDPKKMTKELSSTRVGSDPKETIKDVGTEVRQRSRNTSPARRTDHLSGTGQIRNTSPAKRSYHLPGSGQTRNTSPAKRSDQLSGSDQNRNTSPARKPDHLSESGQTWHISPGRVGSGRNVAGLLRKDNGDCSCRRSPVLCGDQVNGGTRNSISRCSSSRKSGKSPGRVRSELGDRRRSPAVEAGNGSKSNTENRENNNSKRHLRSGINESIENPLVSMECFIFI